MSRMNELEFVKLERVDSMDWLLKTCLSEREYAYKVLEDSRLWNISKFSLNFMEVYSTIDNDRVCVARFMYPNFIPDDNEIILWALIVYPPYRNKGYARGIIDWALKNTNVNRIDSSNPKMWCILTEYGFEYDRDNHSEYTGGNDRVYLLKK